MFPSITVLFIEKLLCSLCCILPKHRTVRIWRPQLLNDKTNQKQNAMTTTKYFSLRLTVSEMVSLRKNILSLEIFLGWHIIRYLGLFHARSYFKMFFSLHFWYWKPSKCWRELSMPQRHKAFQFTLTSVLILKYCWHASSPFFQSLTFSIELVQMAFPQTTC